MSSSAEDDLSNLAVSFLSAGGGVVGASDYLVQAQGTPDNTVKVNVGRGYVPTADGTMVYSTLLDALQNVTIGSNSSGNPRIDAIVLYIDKDASPDASASNVAKFYDVHGTAAAVPVAPTNAQILAAIGASNPYIVLANVAVANGFTSINSGNITDTRTFATFSVGGDTVFQAAFSNFVSSGMIITTSGTLTTSCSAGVLYYGGAKVVVLSDGGHLYTASKDTYVDVSNSGVYTYTPVSNGATAPALTASSLRIAKVVSGASTITSVVQTGYDSISTPIYPTSSLRLVPYQNPVAFGYYDNGTQTGTYNIDWTKGDRQKVTASGALTLTYSGAKAGQALTLNIDENVTGGWAIVLPTSLWPGGSAGTFTTTSYALNTIIVMFDGTNYRTQLAAGFA